MSMGKGESFQCIRRFRGRSCEWDRENRTESEDREIDRGAGSG